jgi:hypothetical protein
MTPCKNCQKSDSCSYRVVSKDLINNMQEEINWRSSQLRKAKAIGTAFVCILIIFFYVFVMYPLTSTVLNAIH